MTLRDERIGVWPRLAAVAVALLVALALFTAPAQAGVSICKQCVDAGNDTASTPGKSATPRDLAGSALNPAVAFIGRDHRLHCALPASAGWQIEVADPTAMAGGCSMVLDDLGLPVISYHDGNGMLFVARRTSSGAWLQQPVDPQGGVSGSTSMARVPGGVGIAYVGAAVGLLKYAEQIGNGAWTTEVVALAGAPEAYPSLVADGAMRAISSYDGEHGDLRLSTRQAGGVWSTSAVDTAGNVGGYTSLLGGPTFGDFGIAYYDFTNGDLKYARSVGGTWMIEVVDGTGSSVGRFCSAVTFSGSPNDLIGIGYYDQTNGNLKYALERGTAWTITLQDSANDTGAYVACGATPAPMDTIGIAYVDRTTGDLLYQLHAGSVAAVPVAAATPLALEWLRSASGSEGRVRFTVPAAGSVRVAVYDAGGRVIAVPLSRAMPRGPAEVRWDGRDTQGHPVRAGVFFVRVETSAGVGAVPAVVLR